MQDDNAEGIKQEMLAGMWNSDGGSMFQGESSVVDFHEPNADTIKTMSKAEIKVLTMTTGTLSESL